MKWMPPPRICMQMSVSYSLATLLLFLGEFCHRNLPTGRWIRWRLCLPGLADRLQMWQRGWHRCVALPRVSSGHWLAVRNPSWSKGQLSFTERQVRVTYSVIVSLAREDHLRWHQFTLSTEAYAGIWLALGILLHLTQTPPTPLKMAALSPLVRGSAWGTATASWIFFIQFMTHNS